jgi:nitric oxide synthase oxygenase domain/subunit
MIVACNEALLPWFQTVAVRMGLDTRTPVTLWKDKALVETNLAVLHSFQVMLIFPHVAILSCGV